MFGDHAWFLNQIRLHGEILANISMMYAGTRDVIAAHKFALTQTRLEEDAELDEAFSEFVRFDQLTSPRPTPGPPAGTTLPDLGFLDLGNRPAMNSEEEVISPLTHDVTADIPVADFNEPRNVELPLPIKLEEEEEKPSGSGEYPEPTREPRSESAPRRRKAVKAHVCPICGNHFGRHYNMKTHMLTHYGRSKDFRCSRCPAGFYRVYDLARHEVVHRVDKTNHCECGKSFFRKDALRRHKQNSCKKHVQ